MNDSLKMGHIRVIELKLRGQVFNLLEDLSEFRAQVVEGMSYIRHHASQNAPHTQTNAAILQNWKIPTNWKEYHY